MSIFDSDASSQTKVVTMNVLSLPFWNITSPSQWHKIVETEKKINSDITFHSVYFAKFM